MSTNGDLTHLSSWALEDLRRSGLTDESIVAMGVTVATQEDRQRFPCGSMSAGYIIPYLDRNGEPITYRVAVGDSLSDAMPFQRIKYQTPPIVAGKARKYEQPKGSDTHVYVPRCVWEISADATQPLVIVEGEKKAICATQHGIPSIGLGGVNNFVQRRFRLKGTPSTVDGYVDVNLSDGKLIQQISEGVCAELMEFTWDGRTVYIVFDSDRFDDDPIKESVQLAAFDFAMWLYRQHADVRQVVLPPDPAGESKVGLDDFLLTHTVEEFRELQQLAKFPTHPNPYRWLANTLNQPRLRRDDYITAARVVVTDLDHRGRRSKDAYDPRQFYYFDSVDHVLYEVNWTLPSGQFRVTPFSEMLHSTYGTGSGDAELLQWVSNQFISGAQVDKVRSVSYVCDPPGSPMDTLYVQLGDSQMAKVTASTITVEPNGTDNVLFRRGIVKAVDIDPSELPDQPKRVWRQVVDQLNLDQSDVLSDEEQRTLIEVLCYLSPLFRNWRGLELPVEIAVGESGSGKSRFYYVRTGVLVGELNVGVTPRDLQELRVFLANARGMYVFDNIRPGSLRTFRDQFEEELSRAVTLKRLQYRPLYTDAEVTVPIDATLAITATRLPIHATDLIERSILFRFERIAVTKSVDDWEWNILNVSPGRKALLGDMLVAARSFFRSVDHSFEAARRKRIRLEGFERALLLMARALDSTGEMHDIMKRVVEKLPQVIRNAQYQSDAALSTLREFVHYWARRNASSRFMLQDVCTWALGQSSGPGGASYPFRSSHELGIYLREHRELIEAVVGIQTMSTSTGSTYMISPALLQEKGP